MSLLNLGGILPGKGLGGISSGGLFGGGGAKKYNDMSSLASLYGMQHGNPNLEKLGPSQAAIADQKGLNAQYDALNMLKSNTDARLNAAEKSNIKLSQIDSNKNAAARNNAIIQSNAARGLSGSGIENQLRASAEQGQADAAFSGGLQAQQMAQQRALSAMSGLGTLGSDINQQAFNRGQAADAFEQFNKFTIPLAQSGQFNSMLQNYLQSLGSQAGQANQKSAQNLQLLGSGLQAGGSVAGGFLGKP